MDYHDFCAMFKKLLNQGREVYVECRVIAG